MTEAAKRKNAPRVDIECERKLMMSFRIGEKLHAKVAERAVADGVSMNATILRLIEGAIHDEEMAERLADAFTTRAFAGLKVKTAEDFTTDELYAEIARRLGLT